MNAKIVDALRTACASCEARGIRIVHGGAWMEWQGTAIVAADPIAAVIIDQGRIYQGGKCTVYPVRPLICQLFGHSEEKMMQCFRGYNVNIPTRDVHRMVAGNGMATRVLHELLPGFAEQASEAGRRQDAQSLVTGGLTVQEQFEIVADEVRGKA